MNEQTLTKKLYENRISISGFDLGKLVAEKYAQNKENQIKTVLHDELSQYRTAAYHTMKKH